LNLLFGQDKSKSNADKTGPAYETVDEGMTTDTTDVQSEREDSVAKVFNN
jgi:uncharacterized DUF497 family protein